VTLAPIATIKRKDGTLAHEPLPDELGLQRITPVLRLPERYQRASWEKITPELADDVRDYCRNIVVNLRDGHGIALVGGVGVGKTHALALIMDAAAQVQWRMEYSWPDWEHVDEEGNPRMIWDTRPATIEWTLGPKLYSVLHRPDAPGHREKIERYETCDLLVVDDFDRLYVTDWNAMQLEALMEVRHSEQRAVALSLNSTEVLQSDKFERTLDRLKENSTVVRLGNSVKSRRGAE